MVCGAADLMARVSSCGVVWMASVSARARPMHLPWARRTSSAASAGVSTVQCWRPSRSRRPASRPLSMPSNATWSGSGSLPGWARVGRGSGGEFGASATRLARRSWPIAAWPQRVVVREETAPRRDHSRQMVQSQQNPTELGARRGPGCLARPVARPAMSRSRLPFGGRRRGPSRHRRRVSPQMRCSAPSALPGLPRGAGALPGPR